MIYGYIRVSTDKQTLENQKIEILNYCRKKDIKQNVFWIEEIISGTKSLNKRKLGVLIDKVSAGDTIICTELSRLGRSLIMIMTVLQQLLEKNVQVIAIKEGFESGDNLQSKVLAFAFGLSAEIERNLLSERTKLGLKRAKGEGKKLGRPKGRKSDHHKLTGKYDFIVHERQLEKSKTLIARELKVSWKTLDSFMKRNNIL